MIEAEHDKIYDGTNEFNDTKLNKQNICPRSPKYVKKKYQKFVVSTLVNFYFVLF